MNEDRLIAAFGRLDRALSRIEHAAVAPAQGAHGPDMAGLEGRHARLRAETGAALAELDALIEARTCQP